MIELHFKTAKEFIDAYRAKKVELIGGSLCFYGFWLGRPGDSFNIIKAIEYFSDDNKLVFYFTDSKKLTISSAQNITKKSDILRIEYASKIRFEGFDSPVKQDSKLRYFEIINNNSKVTLNTNDYFYNQYLKPKIKEPAFSLM